MIEKQGFEITKLKGSLAVLRDRLKNHNIHPKLLVVIIGILATIWFLVRVIPKPSRATYPCMRVAAPFMSGLVVYLLSVAGLTIIAGKMKRNLHVRWISSAVLVFGVIITAAVTPSSTSLSPVSDVKFKTGPDDGPNQPFGTAVGAIPGRVVWAWDTLAVNRNCRGYYFYPENYDQEVIGNMFRASVTRLSGKSGVRRSWDALFRDFNKRKHNVERGYLRGEKIFIKINQTSGRGRLTTAVREKGNYQYPARQSGRSGSPGVGTCETAPYLVLEILKQLINEVGINQSDIAVGDPQNPTYAHNYDAWVAEFPDVIYTDRTFGTYGRTLIHQTKNDLLFYSDKYQTDKLYDIIENADYMINVANLKPHTGTGITLTAKNHFGSQSRAGAYHLHYSHICQLEGKAPTNPGYHKYRVLVDLMGSKYLGRNTLLYVIDGLYSGGSSEGGPPVKYFMAPFNGNWSSSIFISQDQVALESVCYDFLRAEWNGTYSHDPSNNSLEDWPDINGVDDYLHQAADPANWPAGITYDPDNRGKPIPSLGIHEHWNNPVRKQYSRNLGKSYGIELISIPEYLVGPDAPEMLEIQIGLENRQTNSQVKPASQDNEEKKSDLSASEKNVITGKIKITSVVQRSFKEQPGPKKFIAAVLDDNNGKYFLTDAGIFNERMVRITIDEKAATSDSARTFAYELSEEGHGLWFATPDGAAEALIPDETRILIRNMYNSANSQIAANDVISVATGSNRLRWFATCKGISALYGTRWLRPSYNNIYPDAVFKDYPVTAMATTIHGDSLYAGTLGAGVARVFKDDVDGISGASGYAKWGPIKLPSDSVYSILITRDGTQWFGTDKGVARHTGNNTLENWTLYNTGNGLVNNFVQAIAAEPYGNKIWFGTKGGISVYDGTGWASLTTTDGLISNNILFILTDKNGVVYIGTDNGLMIYNFGMLTCYN
jgi:hypothetical protein